MHTYLWIALGSALGGIGRYWCAGVVTRWLGDGFPWGTLLVNVLGSALIGFVATITLADGRLFATDDTRAFVMVGLLGGYTTFSAFSLQTLSLLHDGRWLYASLNVLASVMLCLLAVWGGYLLATAMSPIKSG